MNDIPTDNGDVPATQAQSPAAIFLQQLARKAAEWSQMLPAHIDAQKFASVVKTAVQRNTDLLKCDRQSLWQACTAAATTGLMPDGREGVIVAYADRKRGIDMAQWIPMIAGIKKLVRNSGEISDWGVYVVHENDPFRFELGDEPYIKHRPTLGDPGPMVAVYSVVTFKTGEKSREVMSLAEINKARNVSKQANGPAWRDWPEEMARKTVARRHSKYLPMSTDIEAMLLRGIEAEDMDDLPRGARARLEAAARKPAVIQRPNPQPEPPPPTDDSDGRYDPTTGEITQATPPQATPPLADDEKKLLRRLNASLNSAMSDRGIAKAFQTFVNDHDIAAASPLRETAEAITNLHAKRVSGAHSIAETDNAVAEMLR
jgi:recombination protein RecT